MIDSESIVLLGDDLSPIGIAPKLASHHDKTPLHLAFSCYLFDSKGNLLVTQRAISKRVWPGIWSNSFCGHPSPCESFENAIIRRARHELGITKLTQVRLILPDFRYRTPPYRGIIENEFCPVYAARLGSDVIPNSDEVESVKYMPLQEFLAEIATHPNDYSYWTKLQLEQMRPKGQLEAYLRTSTI